MTELSSLSALMASRICHDLISPIGAIGNGLELLALAGGGGNGPEFALINDSVTQANARIRLYRIAFGHATEDHTVARGEMISIFSDLTMGSRMQVEWHIPDEVPRPEAKLAVLCFLCLESALPLGGRVRLTCDAAGWRIEAQSIRLRMDPEPWAALHGGPDAGLGPHHVQFALVPMVAADMGRTPHHETQADRLVLSF